MDATLGELALMLGGSLSDESVASRRVRALRSLESATEDDLVVFRGDQRYLEAARATRAAAIVCDGPFEGAARPLLVVEDAASAFSFLLAAERDLQAPPPPPGVHPTACVDPTAGLGEHVSVGPFAVIEAGARIGTRARIGAHAFVGANSSLGEECVLHVGAAVLDNCTLGARVVLWPYAVVGRDGFGFLQREGKHKRVPQVGGVVVSDDVEIGCWSSVDRGALDPTLVEGGVKIDSHCHVAHNCKVGENALLIGYARLGGSVTVGKYAILCQDAAVGERRKIGDGAVIASAAGVQYDDVAPGVMVSGFPARPHLKTKRIDLIVDRLPEMHAEMRALRKKLAALEESVRSVLEASESK
jgi:UDP-3-O-[3-hydroxymyristoyl] glucosamine N-acyltransferase